MLVIYVNLDSTASCMNYSRCSFCELLWGWFFADIQREGKRPLNKSFSYLL